MRKMKLGTKLIMIGTLIVVLPLAIVGFVAVSKSVKEITSIEYEQMMARSKGLAQMIDKVFEGEMKLVTDLTVSSETVEAASAVAEKGLDNSKDEIDALNRKFITFSKTKGLGENSQVVIAVGLDGKIFAASKPDAYTGVSIADRQYFKDAAAGHKNIKYAGVNKVTNMLFMPVAAPIYSNTGKIVGVVSNTIDIGFLDNLIKNERIGQTGYAFIVDKAGYFVAHPNKELVLTKSIADVASMGDVLSKMTSGQSGVGNYVFENEKKTCGYAPVTLSGWSVALSVAESELLAPARHLRNIILSIGIMFFVAAIIVYYFFARSISTAINKAVAALIESSDQIGSASTQVSSSSQQLAEGAGEQASSIEETSSSLEELASMTRQNADNAQQADSLVREAREIVNEVNTKLDQMTVAIKDIDKNSSETQKIIKTIDEIAFQTNLLALNAAVEAARAGEAGAGFAVVAEEVRNLAQRSAEAAKNTNDLIGNTVKSVKEGARLCGETNDAFKKNAEVAGKTNELVSEIAAASQEQAQGIEQINNAISEMERVTQQNAANAEESAAASEEMNAQAEGLRSIVKELSDLVGGTNGTMDHSQGFKKIGSEKKRQRYMTSTALSVPAKSTSSTKSGKVVKPEDIIPLDEGNFQDF
ncbi:MAG TPA: methyl-accepting chemotaxis protein [Deltaproteobacteria bacterium]|nr:methyl-accepting chemotaxis protein [Deltaproteobacteria bacterium]